MLYFIFVNLGKICKVCVICEWFGEFKHFFLNPIIVCLIFECRMDWKRLAKEKCHERILMIGCWLWLPIPLLRYLNWRIFILLSKSFVAVIFFFFFEFCINIFFSWYLTWEQNKQEPKDLWQEPFVPASAWRPCADHRDWNPSGNLLSLCVCVCMQLGIWLDVCIYVCFCLMWKCLGCFTFE